MDLALPENKDKALACLNEMCADALKLVPSCLTYLSKLQNPSVFQFAAIPQVMALATFHHFYNNYNIYQRKDNKIRRGLALHLMQV
jgi:farnesyl-diphosphate farnesyltransferase